MKRIIVSSNNEAGVESTVAGHFGRCPFFTVVDVDEKKCEIVSAKSISNPHYQNHVMGEIPKFIKSQDADIMVAGGMGHRAINLFKDFGIEVATGFSGRVKEIINYYFEGKLEGITPCNHHEHGEHSHGEHCKH